MILLHWLRYCVEEFIAERDIEAKQTDKVMTGGGSDKAERKRQCNIPVYEGMLNRSSRMTPVIKEVFFFFLFLLTHSI